MSKFKFEVWEPVGDVTVEADSKEEAQTKLEEYGRDAPSDGIAFEPGSDGYSVSYIFTDEE